MDSKQLRHKSKFLSLILRHKPEEINITLDKHGWANIDELIDKCNLKGIKLTRDLLDEIIQRNDKKRFIISENGIKIRANQGHSIKVDLDLAEVEPPEFLYHGTVERFFDQIKDNGLKKMARHHVHLSGDIETAQEVGNRKRSSTVILEIKAKEMHNQGYKFYLSKNNVWLTDNVPFNFIRRHA